LGNIFYGASDQWITQWSNPAYTDFALIELSDSGCTNQGCDSHNAPSADFYVSQLDNGGYAGPGTFNRFNAFAAGQGHQMPVIFVGSCTGPGFYKAQNGSTLGKAFQPASNQSQVGNGYDLWARDGQTPAIIEAEIFYTLARGYAGIEMYNYDSPSVANTNRNTIPSVYAETSDGCSTPADINNTFKGNPAPGIGQDRWNAASAAFTIIKNVEPYALSPMIAAPCAAPVTGSPSGDFVCGAKQGTYNGVTGDLVTVANFSNNAQNFTFNPSGYLGAGARSWWRVTSTNNPTVGVPYCNSGFGGCTIGTGGYITNAAQACGTNSAGMYDCDIGPTYINGINFIAGNALPAANAAPTTTTVLPMQPLETDVFLYIQ
jgi:hypothetical protein